MIKIYPPPKRIIKENAADSLLETFPTRSALVGKCNSINVRCPSDVGDGRCRDCHQHRPTKKSEKSDPPHCRANLISPLLALSTYTTIIEIYVIYGTVFVSPTSPVIAPCAREVEHCRASPNSGPLRDGQPMEKSPLYFSISVPIHLPLSPSLTPH